MSWLKQKKKHEETDEELLHRYVGGGDLAVLGELYQRYMPMVYGVCLKYLQDEEQSKDAVMQIFEELITKAKNHRVSQFRGWLYVLSRNYCLMELRSHKKEQLINLDDVMESAFVLHPDAHGDKEDYLKWMERCMQKLTTAQRQSIDLFYLNNKCYREIAETTGYNLNEIKSYIQNGKRNLKICLEKHREQ